MGYTRDNIGYSVAAIALKTTFSPRLSPKHVYGACALSTLCVSFTFVVE